MEQTGQRPADRQARDRQARDRQARDRQARDRQRAEGRDRQRAEGQDRRAEALPTRPTADQGPDAPTDLGRRSLWRVLKRTVREFGDDNLTDWAAALTYYGVLSLFPGLLLLVSVLGLAGQDTVRRIVDDFAGMAPGAVGDLLKQAAGNLQNGRQGTAGLLAVASLAGALWSASGYIAAFMRASNAIYDVPEGRPVWKTLPIRIGVTVLTGIMIVVTALAVVFTGDLARYAGKLIGLGSGVVTVWSIAKWPVLAIIVSLLFAVLYWASPNARHGGFRWISPGGILAVALWLAASGLFAFYVANFGSYNETYGSLGAVIIFFVWLWISNIAVLLGAEFDAELQRERAVAAGHDADDEPYLELRDTRKVDPDRDADLG